MEIAGNVKIIIYLLTLQLKRITKGLPTMTDFKFSERLVLIFALTRLAADLVRTDNRQFPDFVNAEKVQKLINELGGNPKLNTKRYKEEYERSQNPKHYQQ
jgi:hypothetical protein